MQEIFVFAGLIVSSGLRGREPVVGLALEAKEEALYILYIYIFYRNINSLASKNLSLVGRTP